MTAQHCDSLVLPGLATEKWVSMAPGWVPRDTQSLEKWAPCWELTPRLPWSSTSCTSLRQPHPGQLQELLTLLGSPLATIPRTWCVWLPSVLRTSGGFYLQVW